MWAQNKYGFTIVELLVVIVVIGVLASIVTVAYSGISTRTENNKTISAVNQAVKLLLAYKELNNGNYPTGTPGKYSCIGTGYLGGECYSHPTIGVAGVESTTFNTSLASVGTIPNASTKNLTMSNNGYVVAGASFETGTRMIRYVLEGNSQACAVAGSTGPFNYDGVTECRIVLP